MRIRIIISGAICVALSFCVAVGAAAQATGPRTLEVGLMVGAFADYPRHFSDEYCEQGGGSIGGGLTWSLNRVVAVEAAVTAGGGMGAMTCAIPALAAPLDGETFTRAVLDEGVRGAGFFATSLALAVEPPLHPTVAPRVRIGTGRLWDKGLTHWYYGGGLRLRARSGSVVIDIDRWNLAYDLRRESLIYRDSGAHELQSVQILEQRPKPYLVTVGWEWRVR